VAEKSCPGFLNPKIHFLTILSLKTPKNTFKLKKKKKKKTYQSTQKHPYFGLKTQNKPKQNFIFNINLLFSAI